MIGALIVWACTETLLLLIYMRLSRHPLDPVALFCYFFFFFYGLRQTLITFQIDGPYPDYLFSPSDTPQLLVSAGLGLCLFLIGFSGAYVVSEQVTTGLNRFMPVAWRVPTIDRQVKLVMYLTAAATVISVVLLHRYHGVAGLLRAGKVQGSLAGSFVLRIVPAVGAVTAASLALACWKGEEQAMNRRTIGLLALAASMLNAGFVLLWGSRQAAAIVLLIVLAGGWLVRRGDERLADGGSGKADAGHTRAARSKPRIVRLFAIGLVLVVAISGLRIVRDTLLIGHTSSAIQGQSTVRQLSVATNSTYFDAFLLADRDWPSRYSYRGGEDFRVGVEAIVPRKVWAGKPDAVTPGSWFRQTYEPGIPNGWPLGAVGDWYLNFGFLGIFIGGTLSGALFASLMATWWRAPWSPFTIASLTCVVAFVVPTGIEALTPLRWVQWAVPLLVCARYLSVPEHVPARRAARSLGAV